MKRLIREYKSNPAIYGLARHIVSACPEKNWAAEVNAVFFFVRDQIRYTLDPLNLEGLQAPTETLKLKSGDCDDKVMLMGALLQSIGHPVRMVAVQVDGADYYSHVFLQSKIGERWVSYETTERWQPGQTSPRITGQAIVMDV